MFCHRGKPSELAAQAELAHASASFDAIVAELLIQQPNPSPELVTRYLGAKRELTDAQERMLWSA